MKTAEERPSLQLFILETTTRCNLRCVHCLFSKENNLGNYDARDLPMDLFNKLLPMLQDFRPMVQLNGDGETLLHPNFMEMLEKVIRVGCRVMFQTNGTMFTPRNVEKIICAGVEHIGISIDAASPKLFEKIRRRARLDKIVANIRLINETKGHLGTESPQLSFRFVAMRQNIHELPSVVKMAGELGVANFAVAELAEYNLTRGQSLANDPLMAEWTLEAEAEAEAKKWGINLFLPRNILGRGVANAASNAVAIDPTSPGNYKGFRKTCKEPWERMFMRVSGKIKPCCKIDESYGDLCVQSFEEVWFGPKYQVLRARLLTDEPLAACVHCPLYGWEPIDSRQSPTTIDSTTFTVTRVDQRDVHIANLEAELNRIYNSHGWKALLLYYKARNKIFPVESKRRKVAKFVWNFFCKFLF
jgi:MoaA/NifB/PqqE/SkfB family radical SAM enzyme